jgi:hypothetical protein
MKITTTLKAIREYSPCKGSWNTLLASLGKTKADDEELTFKTIHTALNDEDLLWCSRVLNKKQRVYLGAKIAETVLSCTKDKRVKECIEVCFKYAKGLASDEELRDAADAADAAAGYAAAAVADAIAGAYVAGAGAYVAAVHTCTAVHVVAAVAAYAAAHAAADADAADAAHKSSWDNSSKIMLEFVNSGGEMI